MKVFYHILFLSFIAKDFVYLSFFDLKLVFLHFYKELKDYSEQKRGSCWPGWLYLKRVIWWVAV